MGGYFSHQTQPKELRIIYVKDRQQVYPILWPINFRVFILEMCELFPYLKRKSHYKFIFQDSNVNSVNIISQLTFSALVPKYRKEGLIDLYYVMLEEIHVQ